MTTRERWVRLGGVVIGTLLLVVPARAHVALQATMDTAQEVPPVTGTATGRANFAFDESTRMLEYEITVEGLTPVAAHIHEGARGVAGGVLVGLDHMTFKGTVPVPADKVETLLAGGTYVNLHTGANPGGEIRGQVEIRHGACDCRALTRPAFKKCVAREIKKLSKDHRKLAEIKTLKRAAALSACGRVKGPKKAIACCFESEAFTRAEDVVTGQLCAALTEKACTKKGGESLGTASSCFADGQYKNPCDPPASPSGAFVWNAFGDAD